MKRQGAIIGRHRRGSILLATAVVVALGAILATTIVLRVDAQASAAEVSLRRTQTRAMAWSGVQGAMAELADQRAALLRGESPSLSASWEASTDVGRVVVRLREMNAQGERWTSEPARLDVNAATAEMLDRIAALNGTGASLVQARGQAGFASPESALAGVAPRRAAGVTEVDAGAAAFSEDQDSTGATRAEQLLTAFAFDPELQRGVGALGQASIDQPRLRLAGGWSEELAEALRERVESGVFTIIERCFKEGEPPKDESKLLEVLAAAGLQPERFGEVLDVLAVGDDLYRRGRVDVARAPAEVLAAIPGMDAESAERLISAREAMDASRRADLSWLIEDKVLTPENFIQAAPWLSTRSLQWRVRIEAGVAPASGGEGSADGGSAAEAMDVESLTLTDVVVLEAVIDVAGERPRLAYLRDVTYADLAESLAEARALEAAEDGMGDFAPDEATPVAGSSLDNSSGPSEAASREPSGELDLDTDLSFGDGGGQGRQGDGLNSLGDRRTARDREGREANDSEGGSSEAERGAAGEPRDVSMKDRRIGRWTRPGAK